MGILPGGHKQETYTKAQNDTADPHLCFSSSTRRQRGSPLFPYTTLFRSRSGRARGCARGARGTGRRPRGGRGLGRLRDRKSTRLNSSHVRISYAVFCLKKKTHTDTTHPQQS